MDPIRLPGDPLPQRYPGATYPRVPYTTSCSVWEQANNTGLTPDEITQLLRAAESRRAPLSRRNV